MTYKLLILFAICSISLAQTYLWDQTGLLTQSELANYWQWFDRNVAQAKLVSNGAEQVELQYCKLDFTNISVSKNNCSQQSTPPWPCAPAAVMNLGFESDIVCQYMQGNSGTTGFNASCYFFDFYINNATSQSVPENNASAVYTTPSSITSNSQCYEQNFSVSGRTNYTATYNDDAQYLSGILQDIYALTFFYAEAMAGCITNFPSGAQGGYLAKDAWDAIFRPLTVKGMGASSYSYVTSGPASPNVSNLATFLKDPYWSVNGSSNTSMQDILFQDMFVTASDSEYNVLCSQY